MQQISVQAVTNSLLSSERNVDNLAKEIDVLCNTVSGLVQQAGVIQGGEATVSVLNNALSNLRNAAENTRHLKNGMQGYVEKLKS